MSDPVEIKAASRRRSVLVDCHVEADLSGYVSWMRHGNYTVERRAQELEKACAELVEFVRDHRSRDPLSLEVVREFKDLCSACGAEWETYEDEGKTWCANCGSEVSYEEKA